MLPYERQTPVISYHHHYGSSQIDTANFYYDDHMMIEIYGTSGRFVGSSEMDLESGAVDMLKWEVLGVMRVLPDPPVPKPKRKTGLEEYFLTVFLSDKKTLHWLYHPDTQTLPENLQTIVDKFQGLFKTCKDYHMALVRSRR